MLRAARRVTVTRVPESMMVSLSSLRCGEVRCRDGTPTSREAADLLSPPPSRGHSIIIIIIILSSYHLVTPHLPASSTITPDP